MEDYVLVGNNIVAGDTHMKILIAEDDAMLQAMADTLMGHWGYNFDLVSNGREAVEKAMACNGDYDLCLMDIDMPVMNGFEATRLIREKVKYFPIMAITGNPTAKRKFFDVGMDDFLGKPYAIRDLQNKINKLTVKYYQHQ
ncbi:response regulator [Desulfobacter sp.]|uniref:response regulator n=1 Tax=Desulfobacter sp. TaxID=2294 RepID=UPI003D0FD4CB